jgi:glucose-6-phosphate isomerase
MKINLENIFEFVPKKQVYALREELNRNQQLLHEKTGKGNDFLGWLNLPSSITESDLSEIESVANDLRSKSDVVVVVGIGGSYLGAKAVIEALNHSFASMIPHSGNPTVVFAGQNISEDYHSELLQVLDKVRYSIVVIS